MNSSKIIFTTKLENIPLEYSPSPAKQFIPEWYKKTSPFSKEYTDKKQGNTGGFFFTIKKCVPVLDAMTTGYIIPTPVDVLVTEEENGKGFYWRYLSEVISMQTFSQASLMPSVNQKNKADFPKFNNPWSIITPKNTSCLIIPPTYAENEYFTCLPGVIDTDIYHIPVNFPFLLKDPNFVGVIPAGTPMVQVVPFERKAWKMQIDDHAKHHALIESQWYRLKSKYADSYKKRFWNKKSYF